MRKGDAQMAVGLILLGLFILVVILIITGQAHKMLEWAGQITGGS